MVPYKKTFALQVDDELKKIKPKDPKLMTARQRAMFERKADKEPSPGGEQLLALPSGRLTAIF
jgi:INO80 complex subunit B